MAKLFANSGDPDQTPHSVASDQGLHCLPITLLRVSRLQWVINTVLLTSTESREILCDDYLSSNRLLKHLQASMRSLVTSLFLEI